MKYLLISALLLSTQASASDQSEYQQWLQQTRSDFQSYLDETTKLLSVFCNRSGQLSMSARRNSATPNLNRNSRLKRQNQRQNLPPNLNRKPNHPSASLKPR